MTQTLILVSADTESGDEAKEDSAIGSLKLNSFDPNDIEFDLYTSSNPNIPIRLFPDNITAISSANFLTSCPLKYILHGYDADASNFWWTEMKDEYLKAGSYNIILVNWSKLCDKSDISVIPNTYIVAKYGAEIINGLIRAGVLNVTMGLHIIGHDIGAHAASLTANLAGSGKVSRITGLDPAKIVFGKFGDDFRLDFTDAPMVDVIHTDGGVTGFLETRGTIDFFPNGGKIQPGCLVHGCNHFRALDLFIESISNPTAFKACKCSSYEDYKKKKCRCNEITYMGEFASPTSSPGSYFLQTNSFPPYNKPS
ncbi:unnamed protein product [Allacma fusca]|uniref:Lipase domain-containing protein n=1 Tax=Allacma fusca TaxID=39272 RepID=A0A8J2PAC0_9HEXA|nr:unnamed protein product [Allacma fusca]